MWRKPEETRPAQPAAQTPPATVPPRIDPPVRSVAGLTAEVVQPSGGMITSSLIIKGEVTGREDLYIDGEIQGTVRLSEGRVTVGPHGRISANVEAREVVVRGSVKGEIHARERLEVGRTGEIHGDITTARISIEEGAQVRSKVEIVRPEGARSSAPPVKPASAQPVTALEVPMKVGGEVAH